jgi:hypothetical protein
VILAELPSHVFDYFFAWAPWIVGAIIYFSFYVAKRHEAATAPVSAGQTYACAVCGRRGPLSQMVPQQHGGAVGYQCAHCAASSAQPAH